MQRLLIATTNQGKLQEIRSIMSDIPVELVSLSDLGIDLDVEETGTTYQENAELKALTYAKISGLPTISDDGGLEIDALDGAPGLHSKRWIGSGATHEDLLLFLLKTIKELPENNRGVSFRCVVSFALPDGFITSAHGVIRGELVYNPEVEKMKVGLPYRRCFWIPDLQKFHDELSDEENKRYNHRNHAVDKLKPIVKIKLKV